jgi:hypothetical protein
MYILFWDRKGVLLAYFQPQGSTINASVCCVTLKKLHHAILNKLRAMLSRSVVMIHDNACPHTADTTQNLITTFGWEQLDLPPTAETYFQVILIYSCILNPSFLAVVSQHRGQSSRYHVLYIAGGIILQ